MKLIILFTSLLAVLSLQSLRAATGDADATFNSAAEKEVSSIALQPDGKILVGGDFGTINGFTRIRLARLNSDGTLDAPFNPAPNGAVYCAAVQQDGSILVGGDFTNLAGGPRNRIARLSSSGVLDSVFNPGANGIVRALEVQADGKIIIGGDFTLIGTVARNRLARLNADGSLDASFNPDVNETVFSIALQTDGKVVIGGSFTTVGGARHNHIARLLSSGAVDTTLNLNVSTGLFTAVYCTALQVDGKILIGGSFNAVGSAPRNRLARINSNGTLDPAFQPNVDSWVNTMTVQADGKILIGGLFGNVDGMARDHLARLNANGSLDAGFIANANDHVYSMAVQGDGEVIIGGLFTNVAGAAHARLARVENDAPTQTLVATTANRVQWLRGGAAPEAQSVRFDVSTNAGVTWASLGFGTRIAGGWELNGTAVPITGLLRARARVSSGTGNGSSGLVQTVANLSLPSAVTLAATVISAQQATLNGTVNARGSDRDVIFEYGTTTAYGQFATGVPGTVTGSVVTPVSAVIAGLLPHKRYHFRVIASNTLGGGAGANATFVTSNRVPVAVADPAAVLPGAIVTIPVTGNDLDDDGDTLTILSFKQPATTAGKVTRVGNALVFTASAAFAGATFDYTISDGFGGTATATVTLTLGASAINPPAANLASSGTVYPIAVTATGFWSAIETLPWVSVNPISAANDGTVVVTVLPNAARAARTGTIKVGGKTHTITQAGVLAPTVSMPPVIPGGIVSGAYSLAIPTTNMPVTYTVTKLPPGLSINNATGIISGQPTTAGTYAVTVKAVNAAGSSATIGFNIVVDPLPVGVIGTFHGSVGAHPLINGDLGSRFELVTTASGSFTGRIISGAASQALTGRLLANLADANHPLLNLTLPRPGKTPLTLELVLDHATSTLAGTLEDAAANSVAVTAWRNTWNSTTHKATAFKVLHTFCIEQAAPAAGLPQGHGFGSFTVTENTGGLTAAGQLADGSSFTTATFIGLQGQVLLYQSLYANKGAFSGMLTVTAGGTPADNTLLGTATWLKPAGVAGAIGTVYPAGFGSIPLTIDGGAYPILAPGAVVMGLPNTADKAKLEFTGGGLDDEAKEFDIVFSLLNPTIAGLTNKATFPAGNPNSVAMPVITPATGAFSGEFTLTAPAPLLARKVAFLGRIVKRPGGVEGCGFAVLPVPSASPQTLDAAAKRSVRVVLSAAP